MMHLNQIQRQHCSRLQNLKSADISSVAYQPVYTTWSPSTALPVIYTLLVKTDSLHSRHMSSIRLAAVRENFVYSSVKKQNTHLQVPPTSRASGLFITLKTQFHAADILTLN